MDRILSAALTRAVEQQLIGRNPCDAFEKRLPKVERREMATLTPEQSAHLLHAVRHSHIYWPVPVGLATGARRGEVLAIRLCGSLPQDHPHRDCGRGPVL